MKLKKAALILFTLLVAFNLAWFWQRSPDSMENSIGMKMVPIEAGSFQMGAEISRDLWNEQPVHSVTISKPFYISETEVTLEQFRQFKPDFEGTPAYAPYAAGVSWYEARDFAEWLSEREGKPYRLPTEAEWEYVARAGTENSSAQAKGQLDQSSRWGVKNMLAGAREWCLDWFGEYPADSLTDPVGPATGQTRIVRGGTLDLEERNFLEIDFSRPTARLSMPPSFGQVEDRTDTGSDVEVSRQGLVGVWYEETDLTNAQEVDRILRLNNNWSNDPRGHGEWSARWEGLLEAPVTGDVTFTGEADSGLKVEVADTVVVNKWGNSNQLTGTVEMEEGRQYPIAVTFKRNGGDHMNVYWSWAGSERTLVPSEAISHTEADERQARSKAQVRDIPGFHAIGFRLVQAPMPDSEPWPTTAPYVQQGVKQTDDYVETGPDMSKPYFRKRYILPTPLENSSNAEIDAVAMHPSFRNHQHSPGLEVMPNGDVVMVIYTSYREYEPGVSLIASRLRFGADEWDMPSRIADLVGLNDHAPLFWNDNGTVHFFWGSPKLAEGGYPFQWTSSKDSGATWSEIRYPNFTSDIGTHSRQPINTAFRDSQGKMYLSSDGSGGESVVWVSADNGETWYDPGGRSAGRHTSFALLSGDRILGMGGKNTHIDDFMPKAISDDGGRSYTVSKTPFARQGSNQRPTLIRLQSGRLLFAGDFIFHNRGLQPEGVGHLGSYVALSEDEGESWTIKKLIGAQLHENIERAERMKGPTLGYAVARQAPNGMIHLVATMNNPCLHFEFNEAWILDGPVNERSDAELMASAATRISDVQEYEERYPNGNLKATWSGGVADDGRFLLHGKENWYYEDGSRQREAGYELGKKVGTETYWNPEGEKLWSWEYHEDGSAIWTQWWSNGNKKAESRWENFMADGPAKRWDRSGNLVSKEEFHEGHFGGRYAVKLED